MDNWIKKSAKTVSNKGGFFTFFRAQLTSQLSSYTDFFVTILLANLLAFVFHKPDNSYVIATFIGQVCGGVVNCVVNYRWTFKASAVKKRYVAIRYLPVWVISLFLNTSGTFLLTELLKKIPWIMAFSTPLRKNLFIISKIVVSIIVGFVWNFNMHRLFVFRDLRLKELKVKEFFRQAIFKIIDPIVNRSDKQEENRSDEEQNNIS